MNTSGQPILVLYLSRTHNTQAVAQMIHQQVGGKLVALELQKPYPDDYQQTVAQVEQENNSGYLPPLKTTFPELGHYQTVFIGFPTWGMRLPPPMKSFLHQHDLSGKTVIPFNTNAGYGVGSSFDTVRQLCKGCKVLPGFSTKGGIERDGVLLAIKDSRATEAQAAVRRWLHRLGFQ
ncbi:MAG: flavodoxin [Pseudomonadota bacterium]|nr:flavodoxin [Gallaecimonas pentaromativorans]MED5524854.1 flavodoxin [Pseudomonadota bacterium]